MYIPPTIVEKQRNWNTLLVLLNPSKKNLVVKIFSVYLSRLKDQKYVSSNLYMETRSSLGSLTGVRVEEEVLWDI